MGKQVTMLYGTRTSLSRTASIALQLWYNSKHPEQGPSDPEPFTIYTWEPDYPLQGPDFLTLVVAACEREFNLTPDYDPEEEYEEQCVQILWWLREHGDIRQLTVK